MSFVIDANAEYLSPKSAAKLLHISPQVLYRLRKTGSGPAWKKRGGRILYLRSDLDKWDDETTH